MKHIGFVGNRLRARFCWKSELRKLFLACANKRMIFFRLKRLFVFSDSEDCADALASRAEHLHPFLVNFIRDCRWKPAATAELHEVLVRTNQSDVQCGFWRIESKIGVRLE